MAHEPRNWCWLKGIIEPGHNRIGHAARRALTMDTNFDERELLSRRDLATLMARRDLPTHLRLTLHLGLFVGLTAALMTTAMPWPVRAPALLALAFLLFSLYAPYHECTHQTAFRTKWLNTLWGQLLGVPYGYSLGMHKAFHFTHHRKTNREGDPEKGFSLPPMPGRLGFQAVFAGALGSLVPLHSLVLAVVPPRLWDRVEAGWTAPAARPRLAWECRAMALCWIAGVSALAVFHPVFLAEFLAVLVLARIIHGVVTVTEHEEMPAEGDQLARTRSVRTNAVFRWFWWNMNFHAIHHAWPAIPWHALPEAHARCLAQDMHVESSYLAFYAKSARGELGEAHAPDARA